MPRVVLVHVLLFLKWLDHIVQQVCPLPQRLL